jgi:hypothetical protein
LSTIDNNDEAVILKDGFNDGEFTPLYMLNWGEASPEEKKRLIIASAIAATIIIVGSVAAIIL